MVKHLKCISSPESKGKLAGEVPLAKGVKVFSQRIPDSLNRHLLSLGFLILSGSASFQAPSSNRRPTKLGAVPTFKERQTESQKSLIIMSGWRRKQVKSSFLGSWVEANTEKERRLQMTRLCRPLGSSEQRRLLPVCAPAPTCVSITQLFTAECPGMAHHLSGTVKSFRVACKTGSIMGRRSS